MCSKKDTTGNKWSYPFDVYATALAIATGRPDNDLKPFINSFMRLLKYHISVDDKEFDIVVDNVTVSVRRKNTDSSAFYGVIN